MIQELQMLWEHGIKVDGVTWRVALVNGIWDGKGFEQVTKTMGSGSAKGCNVCDFGGIVFGQTEKYPFYARYAPQDDPRRLKRPTGVPNSTVMWNVQATDEPRPRNRTYATYLRQCERVENGKNQPNCTLN